MSHHSTKNDIDQYTQVIKGKVDESSESGVAENELRKRLHFERTLSELSASFVRLESHQVDAEVEKGLALLVKVLDTDRCSLGQFTDDLNTLSVTHTYSVPGVRLLASARLDQRIPWYVKKIKNEETVVVTNINNLPPEAEPDKKWLKTHNTKSNLVIPLNVGRSLLGVLGLATTRKSRSWSEDLIQRLKLVGEVFANALMRKRSEQELARAFDSIKSLKNQLEAENIYLKDEIEQSSRYNEIVGESFALKSVLHQVEQVASTNSTVLLSGETGTGKELVARAIHNLSKRKNRTMVKINCAAIPSTLIESELFGREKGAYTGAFSKQIGRFEMANGSTLFLDEISELPLELQVKFLRVLQEKQFERVGGTKTISVDVRIIAATNQNLIEAVQKGLFRQDLFYRLYVFPIKLPPLCDRLDDIPLLVVTFVNEFGEAMAKRFKQISPKSMDALMQYSWPGNIRELRNVIERSMILSTGPTLFIELPEHETTERRNILQLEDVIRNHIVDVLNMRNWKVSGKHGAAMILGLPATTLESKMKTLGIKRVKGNSQIS